MSSSDIAPALRASYDAQRRAMIAADVEALDQLLVDEFTLTHMTGYLQPKAEWLADVASGEMTYHGIEDVDVSLDVSSQTPVPTARTRTDATIWGGRGTWPLQLRIRFTRDGGAWRASSTVASTWR